MIVVITGIALVLCFAQFLNPEIKTFTKSDSSNLSILIDEHENDINARPLPADIDLIPAPPIYINGSDPDHDWSKCPWVNGSGTFVNPYVLQNLTIDAHNVNSCIYIANTTQYFRIQNCSLSNPGGLIPLAIYLISVGNGTVINNTCTISGSTISIGLDSTSNISLLNNTCIGGIYGIYMVSTKNFTIANNICRESSFCIFSDTASNGIFSNNVITGITFGFYLLSLKNATLSQNTCSGFSYDGIFIESASNVTLSQNLCTQNNQAGILLRYISNITLSNNNCEGGGALAVGILFSYGNYTTILANTCLNNRFGIYLTPESNNIWIIGNNCSENKNGIVFCGNNNHAINNICKGNIYGINITDTTNSVIANNDIVGNTQVGIFSNSSGINNLITNNTCIDNSQYGIYLAGEKNTIDNNLCMGTSQYGIFLNQGSINNTISNNICTGNLLDGIYLAAATYNNITNNTCSAESRYGINLDSDSANNLLINNTCTGNFGYGICIQGSMNVIEYNFCAKNANGGIFLGITSNFNTVFHNWIRKNWGRQGQFRQIVDIGTLNYITGNFLASWPLAGFSANATTLAVGHSVLFTDASIGEGLPFTYQWNFGDGTNNSTDQNPSHTFTNKGVFIVTLTIFDVDGDTSMFYMRIYVIESIKSSETPNDILLIITLALAITSIVISTFSAVFVLITWRKYLYAKKITLDNKGAKDLR